MKVDKRTKAYKESQKSKANEGVKTVTSVEELVDILAIPENKNVDLSGKQGLGDKVKEVLESPKLKPITDKIKSLIWKDDEDCGCDGRIKKLNAIKLPVRHRALRCLTKSMYDQYTEYRKVRTLKYEQPHVKLLVDLYAHVFCIQYNINDLCANCGGAYKIIKGIEEKLDIVYDSYGE